MRKVFSWLKDTGVIVFFAISMIAVVAWICFKDSLQRKMYESPVQDRNDLEELYEAGQVNEQGI